MPFRNMTPEAWQNLALLAIAIFYIAQFGLDVLWHNMCGHLASDYCAFWSAGHIANVYGYARVYDINLLGQIEASISPRPAGYAIATLPIPYLPIFFIPFQLLTNLPPLASYAVWTLINLAAFVWYLRFFIPKTTGQQLPQALVAVSLISLPVYLNFFEGQVNLWLLVCAGEAVRASMAGREWRAGLWLAGLLLKPQLLLLIVPVLALRGVWKLIGGLAVASLGALVASWLMIGANGIRALLGPWLGYTQGIPSSNVSVMMNWRMLGTTAAAITSPLLGWVIIAGGSLATFVAVIHLWRSRIDPQAEAYPVVWLGLLAATTLFAWHSHVHTAVILLPLLLYLTVRETLPRHVLRLWLILPAALYVASFIAGAAVQAGLLPADANTLVNFARGAGQFGMSLYLLIWAIQEVRPTRTQPSAHKMTASTGA
jgi:hypothetical protein